MNNRDLLIVFSLVISLLLLLPIVSGATVKADLEDLLVNATGEERVDLLNELAYEVKEEEPRETVSLATEALQLARDLGYEDGEVTALNNLGVGHYFLADYVRALDCYNDCLELADRLGDAKRSAGALNNIGIIHFLWGEYDEALEHYYRSLAVQEARGDEEGIARAYNNLGNVYDATENFEESLRHYGEAITIYEKLGLRKLAASTLNNIGLAQVGLKRYDEALASLTRALEIERELGDSAGMGYSLNHMGTVYEALDDREAALRSYEQALDLRMQIGDRQGEADTRKNIGSIHAKNGDLDRALDELHQALALAGEINVREIVRDTHRSLSELYERAGRLDQALEHYRQYKEVNDSIFNEASSRKMAELQTRFEVEEKDRQIDILEREQKSQRVIRNIILLCLALLVCIILLLIVGYRLKVRANREIRQKNEALRRAHAELEAAARAELAHVARVATMGELSAAFAHELRQPLTAILQNARASQRFLQSGPPNIDEVDGALADIVESTGRAEEIIRRLRALMRRGEISHQALDVNEAIEGIEPVARTDARLKDVKLEFELEAGLPEIAGDRIQLQQVVLNLIQNGATAMRGSDSGASLKVATTLDEKGGIMVSVKDAGPPIDDEVLEQMFDPFYTTREEGLGMGLPICRTIIRAHGGQIWAERNADRGLTVTFTLPLEGTDDD